jgi:hypothetical protein
MQFIKASQQFQIASTDRMELIVDAAATDADQLRLTLDGKGMGAVDYRFALSNPALVSALSKKSFSNVSCPILACIAFTSTGGLDSLLLPKSSAARSLSCRFQSVT